MNCDITNTTKDNVPQVHGENGGREGTRSHTFTPRIDIWESAEGLTLYADMPGVTAENLDLQFEDRELRIHGKVPARQGDGKYLYGEYGVGDFFRSFSVGESIDAEKISAELKDGVLTVQLPKTEAVKPRRIAVTPA